MEKQDIFLGAALLATAVSIWMMWPYADAVLWGVFTAYFMHYFADHVNSYINNRAITTAIMILVLVGFVGSISFLAVSSANAEQINYMASKFSSILSMSVDRFVDFFNLTPSIGEDLKSTIRGFSMLSSDRVISMVSEIPSLIINLLIYFIVAAFLIKDGKKMTKNVFSVLHDLPEEYQDVAISVVKSVNQLFRGVFITYLAVALVVGALAIAGFYLLGVDFYWGWGLIITVFAFFPIVSAPMVYIPLSLLYISMNEFWMGILILSYGVIVLNTLPEVLLRPYLAAHKTQEHPLILFIGFIIGPLVLGLKGIILGPMILVITKNLLTLKYFGTDETFDEVTTAETTPTPHA